MVITFLTMQNKNQCFYNTYRNWKKLPAKNKYKKTLLTCSKSLCKNVHEHDHLRCYISAYSGGFYWPCGLRNTVFITVISPWDQDQTGTQDWVSPLALKCVFYRLGMCILQSGKPMELKLSLWDSKLKCING